MRSWQVEIVEIGDGLGFVLPNEICAALPEGTEHLMLDAEGESVCLLLPELPAA